MNVPSSPAQHVDVLVVGSGPTGSALARTICDRLADATVLLVDGGPIVTEPPGDHMANIADTYRRRLAQTASQGPDRYDYVATEGTYQESALDPTDRSLLRRPGLYLVETGPNAAKCFPAASASSNVGGMGSHWFGACPRAGIGERIDVDQGLLDEAYLNAERLLHVSATQFPDSPIAAHLETTLSRVLDSGRPPERRVQPMPMAAARTPTGLRRSSPAVILEPLLTGPATGFTLRPRTLCRRIVMADDRAVGADLLDLDTRTTTRVGADHVVVAADGLRTPQLLFASGIRPAALGRYFNEHIQISTLAELVDLRPDSSSAETGAGVMPDAAVLSLDRSGVTWVPFAADDFPFHCQIGRQNPATLTPDTDLAGTHPVASIALFLPKDVRPEDRLEFDESAEDYWGMPLLDVHYAPTGRDLDMLAQAQETLVELSHTVGRPVRRDHPVPLPNGTSLHYQGAVRMGRIDDGESVCDTNSQVWGTENVFVAGNGVIPTPAACNPTLTAVALSVLGAKEIIRRLGGSTEGDTT